MLVNDVKDPAQGSFPASLATQSMALRQPAQGFGFRKDIKWAVSGHRDIEKLGSGLEARKSALDMTLEMATMYKLPAPVVC